MAVTKKWSPAVNRYDPKCAAKRRHLWRRSRCMSIPPAARMMRFPGDNRPVVHLAQLVVGADAQVPIRHCHAWQHKR